MVKSSVAQPENDGSIPHTPPRNGLSPHNTNGGNTYTRKSSGDGGVGTSKDDLPVWKRVTDPRGLPEQDASVAVKSRKTLKEEIIHNKVRRMPVVTESRVISRISLYLESFAQNVDAHVR